MSFMRRPSPLLLPLACLAAISGCRSGEPYVHHRWTAPPEATGAQHEAAEARSVAAPPAAARPRTIDRDLALATFDEAWSIVERTHFDPEYNGVDWHGVREELRPRVEHIERNNQLRALVQEMVGRLGQSHFGVLPGDFVDALDPEEEDSNGLDAEDAKADSGAEPAQRPRPRRLPGARTPPERPAGVGIDVRLIDDQVVITSVNPGSPADEAGIRTGWIVTAIGPRNINRLLSLAPDHLDDRMRERYVWRAVIAQLEGEQGSIIGLTLLDADDDERAVELARAPITGERVKFGDLPTFYATLSHERIELTEAPATVGYIAFNIWMGPAADAFAEAVDAHREADGIIIDLRGNPGGLGGMVMGIAGHFLEERLALGTMSTREMQLNFVANPRRVSADGRRVSPYAGPLAILVDGQTGSTSEIFAAGLQALGRAHIVGERTMGAALPAMTNPLPNGDVLLHAVANFVDPNGEQVEGRGVIPQVHAPHTREHLLAGRDAARQAAIDWIVSQKSEVRGQKSEVLGVRCQVFGL